MKQKLIKKLIAMALVVTTSGIISECVTTKTYAAENGDIVATNIVTSDDKTEFTLVSKTDSDISLDMSIEKIDDENLKVTTVEDGQTYTLTYNTNDDYMVLDGKKIEFTRTTEVNQDLLRNNKVNSLKTYSAYSPVYFSSGSVNIGETVNSIGVLCTVIGGAIGVAYLAGVSIASGTIATEVGAWASAVGLGSLAAGWYFNGKITFDEYRTSSTFNTTVGQQYQYRFQNIRAKGKVKGKNMNILLCSQGNWFYASKPY